MSSSYNRRMVITDRASLSQAKNHLTFPQHSSSRQYSSDNSNSLNNRNIISIAQMVRYGDIEYNTNQRNITTEESSATKSNTGWKFPFFDENNDILPTPLDKIVDVNKERRSIIYEITLGRDLGFEIMKGYDPDECALVGDVMPLTKASFLGVMAGDIIVATSATAGDLMWSHSTADGVKSALSTRFVMSANVVIRFERFLNKIEAKLVPKLKVPFFYTVNLNRPIGLHVVEGPEKKVFVQYIKPQLGADRSRKVEVGDEIVEMKASWGDRLWEVNSVESFVMGVKMRMDAQLTFRFKRVVPIEDFMTRQVGSVYKMLIKSDTTRYPSPSEREHENAIPESDPADSQFDLFSSGERTNKPPVIGKRSNSVQTEINALHSVPDLQDYWKQYQRAQHSTNSGSQMNAYLANKLMTLALRLESPEIAVDIFETLFGFNMPSLSPTASPRVHRSGSVSEPSVDDLLGMDEDGYEAKESTLLTPNNFVCTTAIKAYGRRMEIDKAMAILPWMESHKEAEVADVYFMTSLLYVCAKGQRVAEVERLFWEEIPARKLDYTVATVNSLMYLYAKLNRADDVLRLYELIKELGLECTVVTYGVVIKALVRTGKAQLQETALEVLKSLPMLGIQPGVEIYNQMFEYYARNHNYKQTKNVLRLMSYARPRVKPDIVTYGYVIACFADSKKPRSALSAFYQMRKQKIKPNRHTYMGVLKALAHMRDGQSARQVMQEMLDLKVQPDNRHYSMAMFACVVANQCSLAEEIIELYTQDPLQKRPDQALCTLWLRSLLQQGKWEEGMALLSKMKDSNVKQYPQPNLQTYNYLLQYQIINEMWNEASSTLSTILQIYSSGLSRVKMEGNMHGTVVALSFALGPYSSVVSRMNRQDYNSLQYTSSAVTTIDIDAAPYTDLPKPPGSSSIVYGIDDCNEDEAWMPPKNKKDTGEPGLVTGTLSKPSVSAYRFLVSAGHSIGSSEFVLLDATFYKELLRALLLDGQPKLAGELLELRKNSKLKLNSDESVEKIETLANKALEKGLIVQKLPAS